MIFALFMFPCVTLSNMKLPKEPDLYVFLISLAVDMLTFGMTDDTIKGSAAGFFLM